MSVLVALSISPAGAEPFPVRNITLIVPSAPGGFADTIARLLTPAMQSVLQKQIIIDNRSGAGIGIGSVARAEPAEAALRIFPARTDCDDHRGRVDSAGAQ
jgi:tripartite-type tricarboxylate transporter receptor subunit TctC